MKPIIPFALLGALFAVGANAATTDPVGYVSLGETGVGLPAVPANTDQRVSIPMFNATESVGSIATGGIAGSVLTVDGAAYTAGQWVGYYALVSSGANEGQLLVVTASDATSITVATTVAGDTLTGLADGDSFKLSPAWTLDSFLGVQPVGTQLLAFSGTGSGVNLAPDVIYEYGNPFSLFPSDRWFNATFLTEAGTEVLYPGEALIIRSGANPVNSVVVTGEATTVKHRTVIAGGTGQQDTPLAYLSPVGEVVVDANIPVATDDQLLVFDTGAGLNKAATTIYQYGNPFSLFASERWYNATFLTELTTEVIPGGASVVYRTSGAASDVVWSDEPGFVSTL